MFFPVCLGCSCQFRLLYFFPFTFFQNKTICPLNTGWSIFFPVKGWLFCLYGIFMAGGRSLYLMPLILMLMPFWLTVPRWLFLIHTRFLPVFLQWSFYMEISEYRHFSTFTSIPASCTVPILLMTGFCRIICIPASIGLSLYLRFRLYSCTCP